MLAPLGRPNDVCGACELLFKKVLFLSFDHTAVSASLH